VRGGGWLGRSARRGGGGRERQTAARSRAFAVPRRARPSSNPDVLAARRVRKRSRFGWMAFAGDALPANASWPRVDARSASIARLTRACECRSGPRRRTGVAMERRRPGPGLGRTTRVACCAETHRRGRDGCGCDSCASRFRGSRVRGLRTVSSFTSFTATRVFSQSRFSRDRLGRSGVTIGRTRKRSREMIGKRSKKP